MIRTDGIISELWLSPTGLLGGKISCSPAIHPAPGQYVLASLAAGMPGSASEVLRTPLFGYVSPGGHFHAAPPLPPVWKVGDRLVLHGPCGKGFRLPTSARKIALAALDGNPYRLQGFLRQALTHLVEVTLYCSIIPADLPAAVEVLPLDLLPEALRWADFLAIECSLARLRTIASRLELPIGQLSPCPIQVLAVADMPCGGLADCGLCAIRTRKGWRLACQDGPVFDYNQLDLR